MAKSRYLLGQRLSDYQIEKMLLAYAERLIGSATLRVMSSRPTRAANTVFGLYALVRKRLTELGYYPDPERYYEWLEEPGVARSFALSRTAREVDRLASRMHGSSAVSAYEHAAEILFLAENPNYRAQDFLRDIKLVVRITGPLNRPPQNMDIWYEHLGVIIQRRFIRKLEGMLGTVDYLDPFHRKSIAEARDMIRYYERRVSAMMRKRLGSGRKAPASDRRK